MKKTVIQLLATTILQLEAGKHEAIETSEGTFVKLIGREGTDEGTVNVSEKEIAEAPATAPANTAPTTTRGRGTASASTPATTEAKEYTEDQLSKMSSGELTKMCLEKGIDPSLWNGANTNKKLRVLYLTGDWEAGLKDDVADDTPPAQAQTAPATAPSRGARGAKSAPKANEPVLIEDWDSLENGTLVKVQLNYPDDPEASAVMHTATIDGWGVPEGEEALGECLYVIFEADGAADYLREGDKIFEHSVDM